MKRITLKTLALAAVLATVPGLSAAAGKFVVGYTNLADTDVFTMSRKTAFAEAAKASPELSVLFADANGDVSRQLDQIDNFIAKKVNAIVIVPVDFQGIVPGIEKANKAGIPVIALGIKAAGGTYTFVGSQNVDAGRMQGEFMVRVLPKNAQIVYLQGQPGLSHSKERQEGFLAALSGRKDVKVLANLPANYDRAEGMKVTEDWIQRFPKFDALIAANDQMALGALQALKAANRKGVLISGIDGTKDALAAIQAGEMSQSIFQNARGQAEGAYKVVKMAMEGKPLPKEMLIPFESIVKENVTNYMK
ncbi:ABC-type sugar transport system, periplasmic component [Sphaerotilus natans subsp. natans DSM 6575]|uniref:ABC-type sugar transport system, periplasmic component n=1 Tax=Sphaerotilus natans subsp. natans DSM 6575 TaxID=1286631 RepID=A0A059KSC8_9BURK|nr:sugar ABC transporter substrate-binding protein [Sphaerotilus natans]KDB54346.1 ABC-type sugar transport system, periplasmic component [Sphaerotilus natans subsp. natans DSM 6575]